MTRKTGSAWPSPPKRRAKPGGDYEPPGDQRLWYDAMAFCRWLGRRMDLGDGEQIRLPAEWEWQWVAQDGGAAREFPWVGEWNPARANSGEAASAGPRRWACIHSARRSPGRCWISLATSGNGASTNTNSRIGPGSMARRPGCCAAGRGTTVRGLPRRSPRQPARLPFQRHRLSGVSWFPIEPLATAPLDTGPPQR